MKRNLSRVFMILALVAFAAHMSYGNRNLYFLGALFFAVGILLLGLHFREARKKH